MANGLRETATYRDSKGHIGRVAFYVASTGTTVTQAAAAAAILNNLAPITNAAQQSARGPATEVAAPVVYGTTADFATVEDKAVFTFSTADGQLHRIQVPAPKIAIFEVDTITVDAAQTDAAAFITNFLGNAVTAGGAAMSSFVGGVRIRRKLQRKLSIYTKVPELDEPDE